MQRLGIGVLAGAAVAAVMWVTLRPEAPAADGRAAAARQLDPIDRVVGPPLMFGRPTPPDPATPTADERAPAPNAGAAESPEPAGEARSSGGVDPMTGSSGGSSFSRAPAPGSRPVPGVDGPVSPGDPQAPPTDLAPEPSDPFDPAEPPGNPVELANLEAQLAKVAREQGLVDPQEAADWVEAHLDPNTPPSQQQQERERLRTQYEADKGLAWDRTHKTFGALPPNELKEKAAIGESFLPYLSPTERETLLREALQSAPSSGGS
jgi:hypothetical protein